MSISAAQLLRRGMGWGPLDKPPQPCTAHCAVTGLAITAGYPAHAIIPSTTGNMLDILPGGAAGWLSEDAAICYANDFRMGGRLIFEDGTMHYPLIDAKAAAEQERPCWRTLIARELPARVGQRHLCLLNTDYKKRVWPRTPVSAVGPTMRWHINDASRGVQAVVQLNLQHLLSTLALVEEVYEAYPKPRIERGLWDAKMPSGVTWPQMQQWERALRSARTTPEFAVAIIVAQKGQQNV
jgi:hypothetical protein